MALVSLRAYARSRKERGLRGGSLSAVQKAVASGRIVLVDGQVDAEQADATWAATTDQAMHRGAEPEVLPMLEGVANIGDEILTRPVTPFVPSPVQSPMAAAVERALAATDVVDLGSYQQARTRRETAEASLAELKLAQAQGELTPTIEATQLLSSAGRMYATGSEKMCTQVAATLVGLTDVAEIERRLLRAVRELNARVASEVRSHHAEADHGYVSRAS